MKNINLPEMPLDIFKVDLSIKEYNDADILVYQENRENPIFCAWLKNKRAIWFEKVDSKWIEIEIGKETIMSQNIGLAIEKKFPNYVNHLASEYL